MPSTASPTSPPAVNFLSDETNARNLLMGEIRIGATLKKSMTTEKSLVKTHGRVIDSPNNNGDERIYRNDSQSPEPKTNGNGRHFEETETKVDAPVINNNYNNNNNGNGYNMPPTPPSTPAEPSENFYTITVVPMKPQTQEITTTNAVANSKFHALEKSALAREQQQLQQRPPPLAVHKPLLRTTSVPVTNSPPPMSPFSPNKASRFGFTLGRSNASAPRSTGEKLMISHGKPNFVIQKKKPVSQLDGHSHNTRLMMPKLKKVNNSVLRMEEEHHVPPPAQPKPVEVNFVELDRKQRQQIAEVERKFNAATISPSSTTSSMSSASLDQPAVAAFSNHGPNFEQKTYVSFAKDLAATPNKYPDMVKVTKLVEIEDTNPEQFQVDGYDLRLVKIDMEGGNLGEMKVVKRD